MPDWRVSEDEEDAMAEKLEMAEVWEGVRV